MRFLSDSEPALEEFNSDGDNTKQDTFRQKVASIVTTIIIILCAMVMVMIILGKY